MAAAYTFKSNFTILLGTANANVLTGDLLAILQADYLINFWQTQSAAGLETTITIGQTVAMGSGAAVRPNINAAGDIVLDQDGLGGGVGERTDQVIWRVNNPTAGNLTTTCMARATKIAA